MHPFSIYWCKIRTARLLYALADEPFGVPYIGRYTLGELQEFIAREYQKIYPVFSIKESCEELAFSGLIDVYADRTYSSVLYTYRLTGLGRRCIHGLLTKAEHELDIAEKLLRTSSSPNV